MPRSSRAQDLARLGHHLALLGGVVVAVLERLHLGQHVEGDLVRVDRRARAAPSPRSPPAPGRAAPRPRSARCPTPTGRSTRPCRSMPAASRIGLSATTICIVEQLGLATMPWWPSSASGFTSATTSGTSSCIRQKEELSTTTAPASAKRGRPLLADRPSRRRRARGRSPGSPRRSARAPRASTSPQSILRPAERSDANGTTSSAGKPRSRITPRIVEPTAPVAPTTATRIGLARATTGPVVARHVLAADRRRRPARTRRAAPDRLLHVAPRGSRTRS